MDSLSSLWTVISNTEPRPGLDPIPGSKPLTITAAICPPVLYYIALLFLPPPPPKTLSSTPITLLRNCLALVAGLLFFRLPLAYHVPQSIGLTYQLGLVGIYGGCRVLDAFFISPYMFNHIPRRVRYEHAARPTRPRSTSYNSLTKEWTNGGVNDPFLSGSVEDSTIIIDTSSSTKRQTNPSSPSHTAITTNPYSTPSTARNTHRPSFAAQASTALSRTLTGPDPIPVYETAHTELGYPHTLLDRASWALELELSMRGIGFTWTTADVRHTRETWLPTLSNRLHSLAFHAGPVLLVSWAVIRWIYTTSLADMPTDLPQPTFDALSLAVQLLLTAALGAFLMSAFSVGHSLFAIALHPLSPSPLAFFPPLYTTRIYCLTSVRGFWSYGWHRLFARLFLIYGVWPGEYLERKLLRKKNGEKADVGKVLGGFLASAFVHAFSVRGVLGGRWGEATGEAWFFAENGVAVVLEGVVVMLVRERRRRSGREVGRWYDKPVGRVWWVGVVLWTGRNFARGWVKAGLVREMAFS